MKMKTILLTIIIAICSLNSKGQTYIPIHTLGDTTEYYLVHEIWDVAGNETSTISGQTELEGRQYFNVHYNFDPDKVGYLRQDSTNSKAWYRSVADEDEYLIMDLNLIIGDTFVVKNFINESKTATVISIDTFQNRKRLNFDYAIGGGLIHDTLSFIEGIGPNTYFFYQSDDPYHPVEYLFGFLTCKKYINGNLVFQYDPEDDDCRYWTSIKESGKTESIKIYPNPSQGQVYLSLSEELNLNNYRYTLYNSIGQKVTQGHFSNRREILECKNKGIYFLTLEENGQPILVEKILIID